MLFNKCLSFILFEWSFGQTVRFSYLIIVLENYAIPAESETFICLVMSIPLKINVFLESMHDIFWLKPNKNSKFESVCQLLHLAPFNIFFFFI